jgi:hypothetical protein
MAGAVRWNSARGCWEVADYATALAALRHPALTSGTPEPLELLLPPESRPAFAPLFRFLRRRLLHLHGPEHRALHRTLTAFLPGPLIGQQSTALKYCPAKRPSLWEVVDV